MTTDEIREKYLKFFESRGHKRISAAPLVLENDPTTLFTSSGMQPLVPHLKGEPHLEGKRLVNSQPSIRLEDIDEVGDTRHTTFFEMLGNWSLGGYFKKEQLSWFWEFLVNVLGLPKEKLYVSVFEGDGNVPKDEETFEIWKSLGVPEERIHFYGVEKNWWSRSGPPQTMPSGEIGGPDSEVFFDFGLPHDPSFGKKCHPNCDCGRFMEIGNSVFIQYEKAEGGELVELSQKNVDFGGGLERLSAATIGDPDIFAIDLFSKLRTQLLSGIHMVIERGANTAFTKMTDARMYRVRIFLDYSRAAVFLIAQGLVPGSNARESVLRRLIRTADEQLRLLDLDHETYWREAIAHYREVYKGVYSDSWNVDQTFSVIANELRSYGTVFKNLERERMELEQQKQNILPLSAASVAAGPIIFRYQSTLGVPGTASEQLVREVGLIPDIAMDSFRGEMEKHKELSRTASSGMFKGGLTDHSEQVVKLHTATHLLHASLRKVLGEHISQKGSNITPERLRFDFSHPQKLTEEEIKRISELVNQKIREGLPVSFEEMTMDEARKMGALAFFGERYGDKVKVYTVGSPASPFSREVCGGPHVKNTKEIGRVKITKEESAGSGVRRIYVTKNGSR